MAHAERNCDPARAPNAPLSDHVVDSRRHQERDARVVEIGAAAEQVPRGVCACSEQLRVAHALVLVAERRALPVEQRARHEGYRLEQAHA
jgi:hypothetical protein